MSEVTANLADPADEHRDAAMLDALFANSGEAVVITDGDGDIRYASNGTSLLLGYDRSSAVGRSVFEFLHPDDVNDAASLFEQRLAFDGIDQGTSLRLRRSEGTFTTVLATVALLPASTPVDLGACVITLRAVGDVDADRELALQRRLVVAEYSKRLGSELMTTRDTDQVMERIETALREVGLLAGADATAICLERTVGGEIDRLAIWTQPSGRPIECEPDDAALRLLFDRHHAVDDLADAPALAAIVGADNGALLSTPLVVDDRRGAVVLVRRRPGPGWWDSDSDLVRDVADVVGRSLHTAWSERLLGLTYRSGPVAFAMHTWDGELVDCNDRYLELFGVDRAGAELHARWSNLPAPDRAAFEQRLAELRDGVAQHIDLEMSMRHADGSEICVRTTATAVHMPGALESVVLISFADTTARWHQQRELEHAASHDALTDVANRTAFWSAIDAMEQRDGQLPHLLTIDLDRFKHVNDSLGHHIGDEVLRTVARRLVRSVRETDVVARLGGDEFAIAIPGSTLMEVEAAADRLRRNVAEPIQIKGRRLTQTVSIGVAASAGSDNATDLMVRADRSLYAAKHRGRNCHVVFRDDARDPIMDSVELEQQLQTAIDDGQLDVYLQPEFAIDDRRIVGVEALVRYHHPTRGIVPAGEFIEVAERSGLIDEVGRFALRHATKQLSLISERTGRHDLVVRVNISAREFARPELPDIVRSALERSGLEPHRLCLEMTETTLMESPEIALATFASLRQLGVQFAIDDFGTGYSSLAYLKRFPVDVVKIDRAFVIDLDHDDDSQAIVGSILGLAGALGIDVVAEGVEHDAQLAVLAELGCTRAQGFLVAPPMSVDDLIKLLEPAMLVTA